jgi:hypothetical protein
MKKRRSNYLRKGIYIPLKIIQKDLPCRSKSKSAFKRRLSRKTKKADTVKREKLGLKEIYSIVLSVAFITLSVFSYIKPITLNNITVMCIRMLFSFNIFLFVKRVKLFNIIDIKK